MFSALDCPPANSSHESLLRTDPKRADMEGIRMESDLQEASSPSTLVDAREGEVLCDRHRRECYRVEDLFVSCHVRRLFSTGENTEYRSPGVVLSALALTKAR